MHSPRKTRPLRLTKISHVWMKLRDSAQDYARISALLNYEQVWWRKGPRGKERKSKRVSMVSKAGFLYAGFLPFLGERFKIELEDQSAKLDSSLGMVSWPLRDYQEAALQAVLERRRGQLVLPARTGKTVIAVAVLKSIPKPALFIVHTKDLLVQTVEELERFLEEKVGIVGDSQKEWHYRTVGMIQSLADYRFKEHPVDVVIVDECHHCGGAETYVNFLKEVNCPVRIGLTATPRPDTEGSLKCEGLLGPIIHEYTYQQAAVDGWLTKAVVRMLEPKLSLATAERIRGDFRQVYSAGIVENRERNELIQQQAQALASEGKSVLIQVKHTVHGRILEAHITGAKYVLGSSAAEERREIKQLLNERKVHIVISNPIFEEGVNIPALDATIIAGAGESSIKAIQRGSRPITKAEGKSEVLIIDFFDRQHRYLKKHSKARLKMYESKGWEIQQG